MNYEDHTELCLSEIEKVAKSLHEAQNALFTARLSFREGANFLAAMLAEPNQDDPEIIAETANARRWVAEAREEIARWHAKREDAVRRLAAASAWTVETLDLIDPSPAVEEPAPDAAALDRAKSAEYRYFYPPKASAA